MSTTIVAFVESVTHARECLSAIASSCTGTVVMESTLCEVTSVIPGLASTSVPAVVTTIGGPEGRASEIEIVAVRIACIDAEMPVARLPVERAIEIGGIEECAVLPVEKYVTDVEISACPVFAIEVVGRGDAHEVVEVDLIASLILFFREIEFICHLVGKKQSLLTSLFVTHCL